MKNILLGCGHEDLTDYLKGLIATLEKDGYSILLAYDQQEVLTLLKHDARIGAAIFTLELFDKDLEEKVVALNEELPIFLVKSTDCDKEVDFSAVGNHATFIDCHLFSNEDVADKITKGINQYINAITPPFTKALFDYVSANKYTFCTPGHMSGTAYLQSPVGSIFYDFYGENTFKSDISVSMGELGSLLDHSGPHKEAEEYIAETFNADHSYIVTNGTSTANKIVGMYSVPAGSTVLIDRNCHKSLTHLLMMSDITPVYLKPTRNAYGILGGIPQKEFTKEVITEKLGKVPGATWPVHAVITNSTYDGLFYNTDRIKDTLDVKSIHFDSAWVPYTNFSPIYEGKTGMGGKQVEGKVVFETHSTHKLLAAFSQASMIHVKGKLNTATFGEAYMMHTSTSPFYPMVAATEVAAAMMRGNPGKRLMEGSLERAIKFRKEIKKHKDAADSWYFDVWQPENVDTIECWELHQTDKWHGFKDIDAQHMYLDPIKVTLLTPGLDKNGQLEKTGIPATLVSKFLDDRGIIVEKTGPYNILVLFSIGVDDTKALSLLQALNEFKSLYDANATVEEVLPRIFNESPSFYKDMRIQELAQGIHNLICKHKLPELMFTAFEVLPTMVMNPHKAFQLELKGQIEDCYLEEMIGKINANMILPYPPGVPLVMPGEMITEESKPILEFLMMLCEIGAHFPGFETDIHGAYRQDDGRYKVKIIKA